MRLKKEFIESPSGLYPLFASVYSGGGSPRRRLSQFYGDRPSGTPKGMYSSRR